MFKPTEKFIFEKISILYMLDPYPVLKRSQLLTVFSGLFTTGLSSSLKKQLFERDSQDLHIPIKNRKFKDSPAYLATQK